MVPHHALPFIYGYFMLKDEYPLLDVFSLKLPLYPLREILLPGIFDVYPNP